MQITPKDAPAAVPGQISEGQKAASKREAAIKAFMGNKNAAQPNQQETPVSNPSKVSPEEMTAIQPASTSSDPTVNDFAAAQQAAKATEESKDGQLLNKAETKSAEVTPESPKEGADKEPLSAQYAQLARKERALRAKALELKGREDALKSKPVTETQEQVDPSKYISVEEFRKNPWKYMKDAKVSYDQVTQQALNEPSSEQQQLLSVIDELRNEVNNLKTEQTKVKTTFEDSQKNQYNQALNQIKNEVKQLVDSNPEFETVKATGSVQDVVELIEKTFQEDGVLMSVEEATKQVEDYLAEEAFKLSQLKKIQNRLKPKPPTGDAQPLKTEGSKPDSKQPQQTKTLSNNMGGSRQLSARERAIAAATYGPAWKEKV